MVRFAGLILCALMLAGCASVTRGTSEAVVFDSEPSGAEMRSTIVNGCAEEGACTESGTARDAMIDRTIKDGPACTTPCTIQVPRAQELMVTFSKAGYQPQTVKLGHTVSGGGAVGVAGNVLIGGGVGMLVDAGTGAAMDHVPNPLKVTLLPIRQAAPPAAAARKGRAR
jgi:hypothetical protein